MLQLKFLLPIFCIFFIGSCEKKEVISNADRHFMVESQDLPVKRLRLTAVGDIMFHHTQLNRAWVASDRSFDFHPSFHYVKDYLSEGDITLGNLETTMAGPMGALMMVPDTHVRGYQAYPTFNSPNTVADAVKASGMDIVLTSNNHTMDSGVVGVDRTLEQIQRVGLLAVGTAKEAPADPLYLQIQGMTLAILNWSYGTNGISIPASDIDRINSLENYKRVRIDAMLQQLEIAKSWNPDWLIVTLHFGPEYHTLPHEGTQIPLIDRLVNAGADIILGSHPHVLQPMEIRKRELPNGKEEDVFIIYSLGNFLASQPWRTHRPLETDHSVILNLDLEKNHHGETRIASVEFIPIYTQWNSKEIRVIPVEYALSPEGREELNNSAEDDSRLGIVQEYIPRHMMHYLVGYELIQEGDRYRLELPRPQAVLSPVEGDPEAEP